MWFILEKFHVRLRRKWYLSTFGWNVLKISVRSLWSGVSFETCVSSFTCCFDDLSIGVSGCERLQLSLAYCQSPLSHLLVLASWIEVPQCWVRRYSQLLCLPLGLIPWSLSRVLRCLLLCSLFVYFVGYEGCCSSCLLISTCMELSFHPITFNLHVSSFRWHIYEPYFCIHTASMCLLLVYLIHLHLHLR